MSIRLTRRSWLGWAAFGAASLLLVRSHAADPPRSAPPPEFSERTSAEVTTNLLELGAHKDGLRELEESLGNSFQTFSPKSSLDGVFAPPMPPPPPRPVIQNKRIQELIERQKQWIFMSPEDLAKGPTAEEMFNVPEYGPDGQAKKKLSPMEQFYQGLLTHDSGSAKKKKEKDPLSPRKGLDKSDDSDSPDDANLPSGVSDSEKSLRKLLGLDAKGAVAPAPVHSTLSDIFGLGDNLPSPEDIKAHQDYMKRFQEVLNGSTPVSSTDPLNALGSSGGPGRGAFNPASGLGASTAHGWTEGYDPQLGMVNPTYIPGSSMDLNARAVNGWNPSYTPPKPEPPKLTPPAPNFTPPRRAF